MGDLATLLQLLCVVALWSVSGARSDLDPDLGRVRYLQTQVDKRVDTDILFDQYKVTFSRFHEQTGIFFLICNPTPENKTMKIQITIVGVWVGDC